MNPGFWQDKRVFVTGHTGFKGGWLALWLTKMGAKIYGYALAPPTEPSFFDVCRLREKIASHTQADIRDLTSLRQAVQASRAEIVFHLAAQPLVRYSYHEPVETYATNVMGTVHLLEAVRQTDSVKAVVNITTDKCYENREWVWPYREHEALGGYDPYSSSKACVEIVTAAYRRAFLQGQDTSIASVRAGNVIGGGDWAQDRLIPDFFRAMDAGQSLIIRSPQAIRPWQHVLEPLAGYIRLAEQLFEQGPVYAEAWNFGPDEVDARPVQWIVEHLCRQVPGATWQSCPTEQLHEAQTLRLDSSKAKTQLQWRPCWDLATALSCTLNWHLAWKKGDDMNAFSARQIQSYEQAMSHG